MEWIDNTRIVALERCPRSYYWRHEAGLTTSARYSVAQYYGVCTHEALAAALAAVRDGASEGEALALAIERFTEAWNAELNTCDEAVHEDWRGPEAFTQAVAVWLPATLDVLRAWHSFAAIEMRVAAPIMPTWEYRCRIDLAMRSGSSVMLIDHKTTSRSAALAISDYALTPQLPTYAAAWHLRCPDDVLSAAHNILHSARRRTRTGWGKLTIDHAFSPAPISPAIIKMHLQRISHAVDEIEWRREEHAWPLRLSQCAGRYGACEFRPLCMNFGFEPPCDEHIAYAQSIGFVQSEWNPFTAL